MIICLDETVLVRSQVFEKYWEENDKRREIRDHIRDWVLYTWNSKGRLKAYEDKTTDMDRDTIEVRLREYESPEVTKKGKSYDEFIFRGLAPPEHVISISTYSSFIPVSKKSMYKIIDILEGKDISCLLGTTAAPLFTHAKYFSQEIKKILDKPIEVKL